MLQQADVLQLQYDKDTNMLDNIQPICRVPNCTQGVQLLSKQGDTVRYMITCRRHWVDLIPNQGLKTA